MIFGMMDTQVNGEVYFFVFLLSSCSLCKQTFMLLKLKKLNRTSIIIQNQFDKN